MVQASVALPCAQKEKRARNVANGNNSLILSKWWLPVIPFSADLNFVQSVHSFHHPSDNVLDPYYGGHIRRNLFLELFNCPKKAYNFTPANQLKLVLLCRWLLWVSEGMSFSESTLSYPLNAYKIRLFSILTSHGYWFSHFHTLLSIKTIFLSLFITYLLLWRP